VSLQVAQKTDYGAAAGKKNCSTERLVRRKGCPSREGWRVGPSTLRKKVKVRGEALTLLGAPMRRNGTFSGYPRTVSGGKEGCGDYRIENFVCRKAWPISYSDYELRNRLALLIEAVSIKNLFTRKVKTCCRVK
jgi:hypothetical protein